MTETETAIQSLQFQRNEALDLCVNLKIVNHKLELRIAELETQLKTILNEDNEHGE